MSNPPPDIPLVDPNADNDPRLRWLIQKFCRSDLWNRMREAVEYRGRGPGGLCRSEQLLDEVLREFAEACGARAVLTYRAEHDAQIIKGLKERVAELESCLILNKSIFGSTICGLPKL